MSRSVRAMFIAALLMGAVGCSSEPQERLTLEEYVAAGNALCRDAAVEAADIDLTSGRTSEERNAARLDLAQLLRNTELALLALQPPTELDAQHEVVVRLHAEYDDAIQQQSELEETRKRATAFEVALVDIGFDDCG